MKTEIKKENVKSVKNRANKAQKAGVKGARKNASEARKAAAARAGINIENFFAIASEREASVTIVNGRVVMKDKDGNVISTKKKKEKKEEKTKDVPCDRVAESVDARNEQGEAACTEDTDEVENGIIEGGVIENADLHRRWVMAQTFRMLRSGNWTASLREKGYLYMLKFLYEEVKTILAMKESGSPQYEVRSQFFTGNCLYKIMNSLTQILQRYNTEGSRIVCVNALEVVNSMDISGVHKFLTDNTQIRLRILYESVKDMFSISTLDRFTMPKEFIEAYKANGAYYTMQNMIQFHGCRVHLDGRVLDRYESMDYLNNKLDEICPMEDGYKLHGMMKQLIQDNNFDFYERMRRQYASTENLEG